MADGMRTQGKLVGEPVEHPGQMADGGIGLPGTPRSPEPSSIDAAPALGEVAPRDTGSGFGPESYASPSSYSPGAVDTNRPADIEALDPIGLPDPHLPPNVLQRTYAVDPDRPRHPDTPGEEIVETDDTERELESRMPSATT